MSILEHRAIGTASLAAGTMAGTITKADWISAVSSFIAAVVALLTLITVYLASIQILTRRQAYRLGLSKKSLGTWKSAVVSPSSLRMQTQIKTPTLSVPLLVSRNWEPKISFPVGFEAGLGGTERDLEACRMVLAQASWVNFLEGLGVRPEDGGVLCKMQYESELVNGIVPMRWKGRDLAAICSILGFQSIEGRPNTRKLMELPTQWSGPLGWLQFRASSEGCIAEYRRRSVTKDQLPLESHRYYKGLGVMDRPFKLRSRLWQSISGMCLSDKEVIYLSEASEWAEGMTDRRGYGALSLDEICEDIMECKDELSDEEIKRRIFARQAHRPRGLGPEAFENGMPQLSLQHPHGVSDLLRDLNSNVRATEGNSKRMAVLRPSPGNLSVSTEGELVHSRGLESDHPHEYWYIYTDKDKVGEAYKHKLGCLCMDITLLEHMKRAVLEIEPDGFYFSPSRLLNFQVAQIWSHASSISERCLAKKCIFSSGVAEFPAEKETRESAPERELYNAIKLINSLQMIKSTSNAMPTVADMVLISRASVSLRDGLIGGEGMDLIWAILASPKLFDHLFDLVTHTPMEDVIGSHSLLKFESGRFILEQKKRPHPEERLATGEIKVELVKDGTFGGIQVVAALIDVFLNFFWIDRSWVTDIAMYDTTMPQSVTMC